MRIPLEDTPWASLLLPSPFSREPTPYARWRWALFYALPWALGVFLFWLGILSLAWELLPWGLFLALLGRAFFLSRR